MLAFDSTGNQPSIQKFLKLDESVQASIIKMFLSENFLSHSVSEFGVLRRGSGREETPGGECFD